MKSEAVLYASRGLGVGTIASSAERPPRTVFSWFKGWNTTRLCSVVTGRTGNENAAESARAQSSELTETLASAPAGPGVPAEFWDVPALRDVVETKFDVEYESASSHRLLMKLLGMGFKLPDPFDKHRDEAAAPARREQVETT